MDKLITHFLDMDDNRLAYCEHGQGSDLLLLHGNSQSKRIFRRYQLEHFASFHTIAIDSPGHGESTCNNEKLCYAGCCDAACCLCEKLGITDCSIIGYSDGANIALLMATTAPCLVKKAVLLSPNYRVSGLTPAIINIIRICERILGFLSRLGLNTGKAAKRMGMMLEDVPTSEKELCALETDITILYAEHDVVRPAHLQRLASLIPNASLMRIDGCRHMTILNHHRAIDRIKNAVCS